MAQNDTDARYLASLQQGTFSKEERLKLAQGKTFEGIATPPRTLARLCGDPDLSVRVQAKKSILRLPEPDLVRIAADNATSPDVLLFLAKHFHNSPAVGTAIIGNKGTTEKVLYYLQGAVEEDDDERESVPADTNVYQEVEFEVEDVVSSKKGRDSTDDVQVTVELDDNAQPHGTFSERERYSDADMEVVIGVESGQDGIIDEHLLKRDTVDSDHSKGIDSDDIRESTRASAPDEGDFSSAVDAIEGRFDDVFQVETGQHDTGDESPSINVFDMKDAQAETVSGATADPAWEAQETQRAQADKPNQQRWGGPARVVMDETRKEVAVDGGKFVARLPMGRYFYKVSPLEIITRIIRISIPVVAVLVILTFFWLVMPRTRPPVEELEGAVNRVFYSIKKEELSAKIPDPFPPGLTVTNWEFINASPETEVTRGGLKKILEVFTENFAEEIEYDDTKNELSQKERVHKTNLERIAEIDETVTALDADKTKYLSLLSSNRLDAESIEVEYQKEVKVFKMEFGGFESQIKIIEQDTADAKRRIAEYESIFGPGGNDPGYIANKMELEDLTAEYAKLKPLYDKRKAAYDSRLRAIRDQYQNMLDDTVWLQTVEKHMEELKQEKIRLSSENKIIEKEMELLKGQIKVLAAERSTRPKLTGENLVMFLVLSHYMHEKGVREKDEISIFDRYRIYQTISDVEVGLTGNGKEDTKRYALTLMRLETEKSVILFSWGKDSTTWVLTSVTAGK